MAYRVDLIKIFAQQKHFYSFSLDVCAQNLEYWNSTSHQFAKLEKDCLYLHFWIVGSHRNLS